MDTSMSVVGFKMTYSVLDSELYKKDDARYKLGLIIIAANEFNNGFKIKRIGKATKKGTSITFELIKNKNEALRIREQLVEEQKRLLEIVLTKI